MLNEVKHLELIQGEILRFAQNDMMLDQAKYSKFNHVEILRSAQNDAIAKYRMLVPAQ